MANSLSVRMRNSFIRRFLSLYIGNTYRDNLLIVTRNIRFPGDKYEHLVNE